jgi:hypothetical protein
LANRAPSIGERHMTSAKPELRVQVVTTTYYKPAKSPQLLAKRIVDQNDLRQSMTAAEFLAEAWKD